MKKHVEHLWQIANKSERRIVGLMSGTSLDGLDLALCRIKGVGRQTQLEIEQFTTLPYSEAFRKEVRKVFSVKEGNIELLVLLHAFIGKMHGKMVADTLRQWHVAPAEVDLIASHGQTMYHAPAFLHPNSGYDNATLQIGDGDHLAMTAGIITLSDFRLKHIAAGGEGAPLAVYGDYLIFSHEHENRVMLNIGGIANFTWLPSAALTEQAPGFSTDVGPGNTMMDAYMQKHLGMACDLNGDLAAAGNAHPQLLEQLLSDHFFKAPLPKTIGPELFNLTYLEQALSRTGGELSHADVMATLNRFSAEGIILALKQSLGSIHNWVVYGSGGGIHNPVLMQHLNDAFPEMVFKNTHELGVEPDAKEAVLFALLANECIAGDGLGSKLFKEGMPDISMGKISFPG
ncbi:MAG: anhydro-N-acetylmuramic acid kinase [Saprospiraceae bacterium]|nr:anhydro-N-acetylmuramic acid kinase [Saprospiraceae bacterium]